LHIDFHDTMEDTGYAVGAAASQAIGDRVVIPHPGAAGRKGPILDRLGLG
jgi:imidazoleglycerol phosphate dehydratase HisB